MMWNRLILCLSLILVGACDYVHVQVVDMEGDPVEGAKADIEYSDHTSVGLFGSPRPFTMVATTDDEGRFDLPVPMGYSLDRIRPPKKKGYRFEYHCNRKSTNDLDPALYTYDHPFRLVMYKVPEERVDLLSFRTKKYRGVGPKKIDARFDIDLFASCLGAEHGDRRKPHVDFSVAAHFDDKARRWQIAFETTHADTGLLATTNRVYRAPTSGYARRIEVPQEMYVDESFTLYLYTRQPRVYAMLVFAADDLHARTDRWAHFSFNCANIRVNPYGGTLMEDYDDQLYLDGVFKGTGTREIGCLLEEHRYPPLLDMKARLENRRKWRESKTMSEQYSKEIGALDGRKKELMKKLAHGEDPKIRQEITSIRQTMLKLDGKRVERRKERARLDEEILNMFLPDGVAGTNAVRKLSFPSPVR